MLTLKKDLVIEDKQIGHAFRGMENVECWHCFPQDTYLLQCGTTVPEGPLHPIAALAFAMAGFVLCDHTGCEFKWDTTFQAWYCITYRDWGVPHFKNLVIVGHQDPELL